MDEGSKGTIAGVIGIVVIIAGLIVFDAWRQGSDPFSSALLMAKYFGLAVVWIVAGLALGVLGMAGQDLAHRPGWRRWAGRALLLVVGIGILAGVVMFVDSTQYSDALLCRWC